MCLINKFKMFGGVYTGITVQRVGEEHITIVSLVVCVDLFMCFSVFVCVHSTYSCRCYSELCAKEQSIKQSHTNTHVSIRTIRTYLVS